MQNYKLETMTMIQSIVVCPVPFTHKGKGPVGEGAIEARYVRGLIVL